MNIEANCKDLALLNFLFLVNISEYIFYVNYIYPLLVQDISTTINLTGSISNETGFTVQTAESVHEKYIIN